MSTSVKHTCMSCGYEYIYYKGKGLLYPVALQETIEKAKAGELGEEIQKFFEEHPDGTINAEEVSVCCDECGFLAHDKDLTMYATKEDEKNQKEYARYKHKCSKCGGNMHIITDGRMQLFCPTCGMPMHSSLPYTVD